MATQALFSHFRQHFGPLFAAAAMSAWLFVACGHAKPRVAPPKVEVDAGRGDASVDAAPPPPSLYQRLGGKDGVSGIVASFVGNLTADKRINKAFGRAKADKLAHFSQALADEICEVSSGGCTYTGKSMKDAHEGMGVTEAQFDAFVEDLKLALEEKQIGQVEQDELLETLKTTREAIVEKKAEPGQTKSGK